METFNETKRLEIFQRIHQSLSIGIRMADAPRQWLKQRGLSMEATGACFNSGQMHHRKPQEFIDELMSTGFLKHSPVPTNTGRPAHTSFGNYAVMFPLRDEQERIVNFFAIGIKNGKEQFLNEDGIYPAYPNLNTRKLYIVKRIVDAATILEVKILDNKEAVIAIGMDDLLPQHKEAIQRLTQLEEIIWIEEPEKNQQIKS